MFSDELMASTTFTYVVLPALIFIARVVDVSLGTFRIILISRGNKLIAPILGFFEVFIWLVVIGQIMQNLTNIFCYLAYAGGFAFGNYVGMAIEERVALGKVAVRVMTHRDPGKFIEALRERNFGVTHLTGEGGKGPVHVVFTIIERSRLERVARLIQTYHPNAFYTIEDTKAVREGVFPQSEHWLNRVMPNPRLYRRLKMQRMLARRKAK